MKRRTLLQIATTATALAPLTAVTAAPAGDTAAARRSQLYGLLGKLPPRERAVGARLISVEDRGSWVLEKLVLDLNGIEAAPAWFARPKGASGRLPTVLFNHSHGGGYSIGKTEFIAGREYMTTPPYAQFLTSLGYNALCFDTWLFGERATRTELDTFKDMLWHGRVLWGMMVYDALKAVDYLVSRPDVDAQRLATLGMSMGSSTAQWAGALDPRLQVPARDVLGAGQMALGPLLRLADVDQDDAVAEMLLHLGGVDLLDLVLDLLDELGAGRAHREIT